MQPPANPPQARPVITLTPSPPTQGGTLEISYDGVPGTVLNLSWDPTGTPTSVTIDANGEASVTVPKDADSLIVTDPTLNGALDAATAVTAS